MSESTTTKARGPVARYYVDEEAGAVVRRLGGEDERQTFTAVRDDVWQRLAMEGYIHQRIAGHSHDDIVAGKTFLDRVLPAAKNKEPSLWVRAIANVKALDMLRSAKAGGDKPDKAQIAEMNDSALTWAKSLTTEQIKKLRSNRGVMVAHAELSGNTLPLEAMLAEPLAEEPEMQEAAD